jgi:hypothetical protein
MATNDTKTLYTITNKTSGLCLGDYLAPSNADKSEILEIMFQDAGYKNLEDAARRVPNFDEDDFEISEV